VFLDRAGVVRPDRYRAARPVSCGPAGVVRPDRYRATRPVSCDPAGIVRTSITRRGPGFWLQDRRVS